MAVYRQVYTSFWTDAKIAEDFSPEERYLYLYLLTGPNTNLCGCYEIGLRQMSIDTGIPKDRLPEMLERLQDLDVIRWDGESKEVLLLHWGRYNWSKSSDVRRGIVREAERIKTKAFREFVRECAEGTSADTLYRPSIDPPKTLYRPSVDGGETLPYSVSVSVSDSVSVTDTVTDSTHTLSPKVKGISKVNIAEDSKHTYGEYGNVYLTDSEIDRLEAMFPDYKERIERLSAYIASKGDKYESHFATIRNWAEADRKKEAEAAKKAQGIDWSKV